MTKKILHYAQCSALFIAVSTGGTAMAADSDKLVLSLNDVDRQIQKVDFYTCNIASNVSSSSCADRIEITKRDGQKVEKTLSSYTGRLLNSARNAFDSDLHEITVEQRNSTCRMVPPPYAPTLSATYLNYVDHDAFAVKSVEFKIILTPSDCTKAVVTRPATSESYADARKVADVLKLLAYEFLK